MVSVVSGLGSAETQWPLASSRIRTTPGGGSPAVGRAAGSRFGMDPSLRGFGPDLTLAAGEAPERVADLGVDLPVHAHPDVRGAHLDQLGRRIQAGAPVDDAVGLGVQRRVADL